MANEIGPFYYSTPALATLYAVMQGADKTLVSTAGGALVALSEVNWPNADIALSDTGHPTQYYASVPSGTPQGRYTVDAFLRAGVNPDIDADLHVGGPAVIDWDGTQAVTVQTITQQLATGEARVINTVANGDITIRRGDSYNASVGQRITIVKPSGAAWPSDLTSWVIKFSALHRQYKDHPGESSIDDIVCVHGTETGASQSFHIDLTSAQTSLMAVGMWAYDVQASSGSDRNTLIGGNLRVLPEYTTP